MTMKLPVAILFAALACAVSAQAQTVKVLSYNTTNDTIVQTQRVIFPRVGFTSGTSTAPSLNFTAATNSFGVYAATQLGVGPHLGFSVDGTRRFFIATNQIRAELPISFGTTANAAETRTNLGLGWSALTNTNAENFEAALFPATNAAPTNTTNVAGWVDLRVGTNTFKFPLYQ